MTERLYLQDAYMATFSARIVERILLSGGQLAVVLDRTAFHPGTARLPADRGWLNRVPVVEVKLREDGAILHLISEEIWEDQVQGQIEWPRRLSVMRHHTGGHLLAQASGASASSIFVNERSAWLDLERSDLSPAQIEQIETAANLKALSNHAIRAARVDTAQARQLGLPIPPDIPGPLQAVSIEGDKAVICDGIHVVRTGEVGLIKVLGHEASGSRLRIHFVCGERALAEFRRVEQTLAQIACSLGVAPANVMSAFARTMAEANAARAEMGAVRSKMIDLEAQVLAARAEAISGARVVWSVYPERDTAELRQLARLIVTRPGLIALLGASGEKAQLVFARSADVSYDMTVFIRAAAQVLNAQGGGQPSLAESLPVRADEARVEAAVNKAYKLLQAQR